MEDASTRMTAGLLGSARTENMDMASANKIRTGPRLDLVAMPLVELMAQRDLSWDMRNTIADALRASISQWKSMDAERRMFDQAASTDKQRIA